MSLWLERLSKHHEGKGNQPRADLFAALAAEERASKTPETFSDVLVLPEGVRQLPDLTIGGVNEKELEKRLNKEGHRAGDWAMDLLRSKDFTTLSKPKTIPLIDAPLSAMGFTTMPTIDQIFQRADELKWDKVPAETGPHLRLAYTDQPLNEWLHMGMKSIADRDGGPRVFRVERHGDGSWLRALWVKPTRQWSLEDRFVFSPRK